MAEEDSSQEKTEEPTSRKLEKTREEGNVVRSKELNTSAILIVSAICILVFGPLMGNTLMEVMRFCFDFDARASWDTNISGEYFLASIYAAFTALLPFFALLLLTALAAPMSLGGWNFSTKALAPKASRMNPFSGLKRMFSMNSLVELLKGWGKVIVVATSAILVLFGLKDQFLSMIFEPTPNAIAHASRTLAWSFLLMACSTLIIALIDVPFQIFSHAKKLRMTMQEIKDEYKSSEGKPEIKAKIRQLQRDMANRRMMSDVPEADVIITNPTHYAVALKYKPNEMPAPLMVAKGVDMVALKIREIGGEYKVPILELPALSRSIYHHTEIGGEIPEGLYIAVAQVLAYIYQVEQWKKGNVQEKPQEPSYPIPNDLRQDT
ncbi:MULTISPECIES: flagellar biosynthesis protein FlhB [Reinekea]|jgi:flagellar biosynthetic protein FlhB|uniref:Flagellar biosynthetic protein FlhB n=1 Tax=Reinekea forsetii TaxID=1336806 RepID=A0A2K8KPI4_9GAMM|nr:MULTISPECIES: flagellar biosynthesis protein FlhB [Reinekea]ATX76678.1 flagellar biosynthesis protein FlhB [Reinekea forsetii]MDB9894767.1 flagellar biosynthesis protein FlhB [Reinekea forsetii]MDO7645851.1 flagellar biosynthesis protein FlhB [Reinekea forsetii]